MNTKTAIVTIAGRPNVGKSTLTNHLVGEKIAIVSNKPQTTRNRICGIVTRGNTQFVFVDTPGYHRARTQLGDYMVNVARDSIADVDLTILVVEPVASVGAQEEALIAQLKGKSCICTFFSRFSTIDTSSPLRCASSKPRSRNSSNAKALWRNGSAPVAAALIVRSRGRYAAVIPSAGTVRSRLRHTAANWPRLGTRR